jgi:hypothetical protein
VGSRCTLEVVNFFNFLYASNVIIFLESVEKEDVCDMILDETSSKAFENAIDRQVMMCFSVS